MVAGSLSAESLYGAEHNDLNPCGEQGKIRLVAHQAPQLRAAPEFQPPPNANQDRDPRPGNRPGTPRGPSGDGLRDPTAFGAAPSGHQKATAAFPAGGPGHCAAAAARPLSQIGRRITGA
jgi:hypothetical protein